MKILVTLPTEHPSLPSLEDVLAGKVACSGTTGAIVRLAEILQIAGMDVTISGASNCQPGKFRYLLHSNVNAIEFDKLIIHQTHWNGEKFTFGNPQLPKAILYLHNQTPWAFIASFFQWGGYRLVCPSLYLANLYRAIPKWKEKIAIIGNSYCPVFSASLDSPQPRLLFVGAVTPNKGFNELMQVWSCLAKKEVDLQFAIAGGISLHHEGSKLGPLGATDDDYERGHIQPWYQSLPAKYQPQFLGALCPLDLRREINQSWAVIVNPGWQSLETFSVAAAEAQACDRTVFSVMAGGLRETVYQGSFPSLTRSRSPADLCDLILQGLKNPEAVTKNGQLAGDFVRNQFSFSKISQDWLDLLAGKTVQPIALGKSFTPDTVAKNLMRWTGTGMALKTVYGRLRDRAV
jgi:glycosyltransferase involved in cell wall biosynthesis